MPDRSVIKLQDICNDIKLLIFCTDINQESNLNVVELKWG